VDLGTALVPPGWRERLVLFDTEGTQPGRGWYLERHDLAVSKLIAGRPKDYEFVDALLEAGLLDLELLRQRFDALPRDRAIPAFAAKAERWLRSRPRT